MPRIGGPIAAFTAAVLLVSTTAAAGGGWAQGDEPAPFCSAEVEAIVVVPAAEAPARIVVAGPAAPPIRAQLDAMRAWHASFSAALGPLLTARRKLYDRMPHRLFASVRPDCEAVARAVEEAAELYPAAPARHVEILARDLLVVYRESAGYCVAGAYFSFTVRERKVRQLVADLYVALDAYGLEFPRAASSADVSRRR